MPRHGRLDVPAALNHIAVRRIDKSAIVLHGPIKRRDTERSVKGVSREREAGGCPEVR
jgi:hypothetical protein